MFLIYVCFMFTQSVLQTSFCFPYELKKKKKNLLHSGFIINIGINGERVDGVGDEEPTYAYLLAQNLHSDIF